MMKTFLCSFLLISAPVLVQSQMAFAQRKAQESKQVATVRRAIEQANNKYEQALVKADPALYSTIWTRDAIQFLDGRILKGRRNIVANNAKGKGKPEFQKVILTTKQLEVKGNTAYEVGRYSFTDLKGKTSFGNSFSVWKRQSNGAWKLAVESSFGQ